MKDIVELKKAVKEGLDALRSVDRMLEPFDYTYLPNQVSGELQDDQKEMILELVKNAMDSRDSLIEFSQSRPIRREYSIDGSCTLRSARGMPNTITLQIQHYPEWTKKLKFESEVERGDECCKE
jgi:hypothetical protein